MARHIPVDNIDDAKCTFRLTNPVALTDGGGVILINYHSIICSGFWYFNV